VSLVGNALTTALAIVADAKDESLFYRVNETRAWVALTGFVLDRDDVVPPIYEEDVRAEATVHTGRLSGPLTPRLDVGYQVKDGAGDVWAIINPPEFDQQQLCALRRTTLDNAGPNRGGAL
jgi:hypothetical protein